MKLSFLTFAGLILLLACSPIPTPTQEKILTTSTPKSKDVAPCAPENWGIAITSIEQSDLGDGTKYVFFELGIENNDLLWGKVSGPIITDKTETKESVFLTTEDGSLFKFTDDTQNEITEQIETPLLPPGFVTLGNSFDGNPDYYSFSFLIPESQTPNTLTIGSLNVDCNLPHVVGENGKIIYREKSIQIPAKTYYLDADITEVHQAPSARRFPNLVGAELVTPDWKETIFVTDVTRIEDTIVVTFDFTNFSSHAISPSFEGYLMGDNRVFICQNDCKQRPTHEPIEPGRTAQDLTWIFTVPEDETNLVFAYVYGGMVDLNQVYRVNLE